MAVKSTDVCPWCGAGLYHRVHGTTRWRCNSYRTHDVESFQSDGCKLRVATRRIAELEAEVRELRRKVTLLHDATIILRRGMGGHNHWEEDCPACRGQREAIREATAKIEATEQEQADADQ